MPDIVSKQLTVVRYMYMNDNDSAQQLHSEASGTSFGGGAETSISEQTVNVMKVTSCTINYALVFASCPSLLSIPGSDMAIFLKRLLTLWPAFAEVSMNRISS